MLILAITCRRRRRHARPIYPTHNPLAYLLSVAIVQRKLLPVKERPKVFQCFLVSKVACTALVRDGSLVEVRDGECSGLECL